MFGRRKEQAAREAADKIGRLVVRSAALRDEEAREVASGMSYAGVQARIRARTPGASEPGDNWLAALLAARQAIPAMIVIAAIAAGLLWATGVGAPPAIAPTPAFIGAGGAGVNRVEAGGTCAISTSDECAISTDEVLATIVSRNEQEVQ